MIVERMGSRYGQFSMMTVTAGSIVGVLMLSKGLQNRKSEEDARRVGGADCGVLGGAVSSQRRGLNRAQLRSRQTQGGGGSRVLVA